MTKSQKYLIIALGAFLGLAILIFRPDMLAVPNRPRINHVLTQYVGTWGITIFGLLFFYYLSKSIKVKPFYIIVFLVLIELVYLFVFHLGPMFFSDNFKTTALSGHFKRIAADSRSLIQFQEESAQYDSELFYTLKENSVSRFKGLEFDTEIEVNSMGVRDNEENLINPEVIFLGDSYTMGWGVEEDQRFSNIFEDLSGLKTLNTGVSSYGTAREGRFLTRFNTDSLKLLVIQYHESDLAENNYFVENNKLGDKQEYEFEHQLKHNDKITRYYPFKYLKEGLVALFTPIDYMPETGPAEDGEKDPRLIGGVFNNFPDYTEDYFKIIEEIRKNYQGPIIHFYVGSFYTMKEVIDIFEGYANKNQLENSHFVNLGGKLDETDYFFFDDHINKKGHQKVAEELFEKTREIGIK